MRGPKRASKIRKLFNLSKDDDVRKYRLVTPLTLQRKRARIADKKKRVAYINLAKKRSRLSSAKPSVSI
ncbi:hypothetical protein G4B88_025778 [Cannabis sativa]|uniref:Ribosomal protein S6 n=1 Tax=Cannabis sativa TaxID=3483 RepID=A0A7J6DM65_CANSA|nr:hypothetical protein G4B88_025778 [Cannabis sativa]